MYWTEPKKEKSKWVTINKQTDGKVLSQQEFSDKSKCLFFLKTINIYIDDKLVFTGQ